MPCYQCGSPGGTATTLCPHCLEKINPADKTETKSALTAPRRFSSSDWIGGIISWILIIALLVVGYYRHTLFGFGTLPDIKMRTISGEGSDPCDRKQRCVIAFFAPWCPTCRESLGFLADMRTRLANQNRIGIKVIVGMDETPKLEELARHIGGDVFLDTDHKFESASGIGAVPAWWVIDAKRTILGHGDGFGISGNSAEQNYRYFVNQVLHLGGYLPPDK